MYKLIFFCTLHVSFLFGSIRSELDLKDVSPEVFPHHALVDSNMICNGILLSADFVLTPACCVYGYKTAKVYLGFSRYPYYTANRNETNTQIRTSSDIFIHEDFAKLSDQHYLNNIAIIKLAQPATLNNKVKPARLISRQNAHLGDGRFVNVTGWIISKNTNLKFATVRIRNKDTCSVMYGSKYLRNQELCVRWSTNVHLNLVGNSVLLENEIIGIQMATPPCSLKTCSSNEVILSITPFLDWIAYTTEISEAQLNGQIKHENNSELNSFKLVELAAKLDNLTLDIQNIRVDLGKFAITLDEQISDVRSQISISQTRANQDRLDLEEVVESTRTELTNGLSAQRSLNELVAEFNKSNNDVQVKMIEELNQLKQRIEDLEVSTNITDLENESRFLRQQDNISELYVQISDSESKGNVFRHSVFEDIGKINDTLEDLYTNHSLHNDELSLMKETYSKFMGFWHEYFIKTEQRLDEYEEKAGRNIDSNRIAIANIKENLESQRQNMDYQITEEKREVHYLKEKIHDIIEFLKKISF